MKTFFVLVACLIPIYASAGPLLDDAFKQRDVAIQVTRLKAALKSGENPNELVEGRFYLAEPIASSCVECVRLLLEAGADPNIRTKLELVGATEVNPLREAVFVAAWLTSQPSTTPSQLKSAAKILSLLIKKGADLKAHAQKVTGHKESVLFVAISGAGDNEAGASLVRQLLKHGADVEFGTEIGGLVMTPLMLAAQNGKATIARTLVKAGASKTIRGLGGHNASEWAKASKHFELAKELAP